MPASRQEREDERRGHLKEYILGCIGDNILSWGDLVSPKAYDKLLGALSRDFWIVVKEDLLPRAGFNLLGAAATRIAEHVANSKKRKRA